MAVTWSSPHSLTWPDATSRSSSQVSSMSSNGTLFHFPLCRIAPSPISIPTTPSMLRMFSFLPSSHFPPIHPLLVTTTGSIFPPYETSRVPMSVDPASKNVPLHPIQPHLRLQPLNLSTAEDRGSWKSNSNSMLLHPRKLGLHSVCHPRLPFPLGIPPPPPAHLLPLLRPSPRMQVRKGLLSKVSWVIFQVLDHPGWEEMTTRHPSIMNQIVFLLFLPWTKQQRPRRPRRPQPQAMTIFLLFLPLD